MKRALLIVALVLALRLPFLNQAIQGDDPYYLAGAEHAQIEPLHPNHTSYLFQGKLVDMRGHPHPPLNSWALAALLAWFGDVREKPFHATYILFSLIAALSMLKLAERFSTKPLLATVLFCAVPAFVINGNSLEADVPFLAFWMLAIALFIYGADRNSRTLLAGSAIAAALAALGAYQAIFLTPVLAAYLFFENRGSPSRYALTLAAPATLALYQLSEKLSSGSLPATVLAGYIDPLEARIQKLHNAAALTVHLGWMVCPLLLMAVIPRAGRWRQMLAVAAAIGAASFDSNPLFWVTFACGVWMLAYASDKGFLGVWILIFFTGAVVVFFAGSARYLLPIAAPVAILTANEARRVSGAVAVAAGLVLALLLTWANYEHWDRYRTFAASLQKDAASRRVWINSELGLRYYLESEGALPVEQGQRVQPGELAVTSLLAPAVNLTGVAPLRHYEVRPFIPLRLISPSGRSGYSTAARGLLPFEISFAPVDVVEVASTIEPTLSYLEPAIPGASAQILGGWFSDGWITQEATVVLKTPPVPGPVVLKFYIPPNAAAREVRLTSGGATLGKMTVPAPGVYQISGTPLTRASTLALTVTVDRTFTAPPDTRALGMVVTGIGFGK